MLSTAETNGFIIIVITCGKLILVKLNNKLFKNAINTITIATGTKLPIGSANAGEIPEPSKSIRPTFLLTSMLYNSNEIIPTKIAVQVLNYYKNKYELILTKSEIQYISSLIVGQIKSYRISFINSSKFISEQFQNDIMVILNDAFEHYMLDIDFSENTYNFSMHVYELIKRSKAMQPAYNYAVKSLKSEHPFIYEVAVYIANKLANKYMIKINDSEIGFICIYIGSLVENAVYRSQINCLFVCDNYHQIKYHLYNKLITILPTYVKLKCKEKTECDIFNYDFIITTDASSGISKNIIEISPFLTRKDFDKINSKIQNITNLHTIEKINYCLQTFLVKIYFTLEMILMINILY